MQLVKQPETVIEFGLPSIIAYSKRYVYISTNVILTSRQALPQLRNSKCADFQTEDATGKLQKDTNLVPLMPDEDKNLRPRLYGERL